MTKPKFPNLDVPVQPEQFMGVRGRYWCKCRQACVCECHTNPEIAHIFPCCGECHPDHLECEDV